MSRAVILAAGRGSRLGSLTDNQPKCLTEVGGKALLDWQIEALRTAGIVDVGIVRGYKSELLVRDALKPFDNPRWQETNMVVSLGTAGDWLSTGPIVVSYSDIVYHPDHVTNLLGCPGDIAITYDRQWRVLWELRFDDPLDDAETFRVDRDGRLLEIGQRPTSIEQVSGQYMGLLKLTPAGWRSICSLLDQMAPRERDRLDTTGLLSRLIATGVTVDTVPIFGRWIEVDSAEDLRRYEAVLDFEDGWPVIPTQPGPSPAAAPPAP